MSETSSNTSKDTHLFHQKARVFVSSIFQIPETSSYPFFHRCFPEITQDKSPQNPQISIETSPANPALVVDAHDDLGTVGPLAGGLEAHRQGPGPAVKRSALRNGLIK